MRLYIIRHGETEWNKEKRMQGQRDIMLDQARNPVSSTDRKGHAGCSDRHSNQQSTASGKADSTACLANRAVPIITDERIQEMSFGDWEGESIRDSKVVPQEFIDKFYHDPMHCIRPPHGETFPDVVKRTGAFFESLVKDGSYDKLNILVSTHGAASRCLLSHFYEDKEDIWRGCVPPNCSVSIVDVTDGIGTVVEKDKIYAKDPEVGNC